MIDKSKVLPEDCATPKYHQVFKYCPNCSYRAKIALPYQDEIFYLSGGMTGYPEYNYPKLKSVTELLRKDDYNILSPHENPAYELTEDDPGYDEEARWQYYMALDKEKVEASTAILLMVGWPESRDSRTELSWSLDLRHTVYYFYEGHPYTIVRMSRES